MIWAREGILPVAILAEGAIFRGGGNISGAIFRGGNFPGGNLPGGNFPGTYLFKFVCIFFEFFFVSTSVYEIENPLISTDLNFFLL